MLKRVFSIVMFILLVTSILILAFKIQPVKAEGGTIYIRADGSIDPPTAPISSVDNISYVFAGNITSDVPAGVAGIVVERSNIIIDGANYAFEGTGTIDTKGIDLTGSVNVTIKNLEIQRFYYGIYTENSTYDSIHGNNITANNGLGIWFDYLSNYNIISENNITNNGYGIAIAATAPPPPMLGNSISGNNITDNGGYGILLQGASLGSNVSGNNITNNGAGIVFDTSPDNSISGNNIRANNGYGMYLLSGSNNSISGNDIAGNSGDGITLSYSSYNSISGNNVTNNLDGIYLYGNDLAPSSYNSISINTIATNRNYGVYLMTSSSDNAIYHNNFVNNNVQVNSSNSANVWDNGYPCGGNYWSDYSGTDIYCGAYQNQTGSDGIGDTPYVIDANNTDNYPLMKPYAPFENQTIYIRADGSIDPTGAPIQRKGDLYALTDNITSNTDGIVIERDNITLDGAGCMLQCASTYSSDGIVIGGVNVTVKSIEVKAYGNGIILDGSLNSTLSANTITDNWYDIYLNSSSNYNSISGNNIATYLDGICLDSSSSYNIISGNNITSCGCGIAFWDSSNYNSISENNMTANAGAIGLWNSSGNSISGNNITNNGDGIDFLFSSNYNSISGNNITNNGRGFFFNSGSNNSISGNDIASNVYGIYTEFSSGNSISGNSITGSTYSLQIWNSSGNSISGNNITTSNQDGIDIELSSNYNSISGNNITANNLDGINLGSSSDNNVSGNNITANNRYGIWLGSSYGSSSSNNTIYHNNFVNNTVQVLSTGDSLNTWDNGYPSGGNYWSDYKGIDLYSGLYQNETGSDGIGDTPYIIDANNTDNYPLMNPYGSPPPPTYSLTITATAGGATNPPSGTYTYSQGQTVPVQAAPNIGYVFDHWELDSTNISLTNPMSVLMDENHTLYAVFVEMNYTLQITTTVGGATDPAADTYTYPAGLTIQVTGIPDTGYVLDHWELDGANVGPASPITVLMDSNHTLHTVFSPIYTLIILTSTGGTTDPTPGSYTYVNGTYASVTAIPDTYYLLDYWLLDGNNVGSSNPITVLMTDGHTLQPVFVLPNYTLTITATTGGTTSPVPGTYTNTSGTAVSVQAIPDTGYVFDHWELNGTSIGSANPVNITMDADYTLNATFAEMGGVGGVQVSIDKFSLLAPYIGFASTLMVAAVASAFYVKRVKHGKEKQ